MRAPLTPKQVAAGWKDVPLPAPRIPKAAVVLEVMWDWRNVTTAAGYREKAPPFFDINPHNHSGRRLHQWLKGYDFKVTNACPQLVSSAKHRGTPDAKWLHDNLASLYPLDLLLVCGEVAKATLDRVAVTALNPRLRIIYLPHPAARFWSKQGIQLMHDLIRESPQHCRVTKSAGSFIMQPL